ncbi:ubiquitin carboxyl-terminal hydrolase 43-like [Lethenteron reissneri]|uniref:ubiquitin carboxyl-terminal hydrolase 43-like n=1 Tax=Lethenteron reissneri TaxID=7753 RepID=UPI002AB66358|nr:ubiquitin carboxyl-terminal hydrolase 43-like [Lethenteron reissneri]
MTPHVVRRSQSTWTLLSHWSPWRRPRGLGADPDDLRYDLYAVCNHNGRLLQSGHYTAFCKNSLDGQWYCFDDSAVEAVEEERVCTRAAYILFYQRRSAIPAWSASSSHAGSTCSSLSEHWVNRLPGLERRPSLASKASTSGTSPASPHDSPSTSHDPLPTTDEDGASPFIGGFSSRPFARGVQSTAPSSPFSANGRRPHTNSCALPPLSASSSPAASFPSVRARPASMPATLPRKADPSLGPAGPSATAAAGAAAAAASSRHGLPRARSVSRDAPPSSSSATSSLLVQQQQQQHRRQQQQQQQHGSDRRSWSGAATAVRPGILLVDRRRPLPRPPLLLLVLHLRGAAAARRPAPAPGRRRRRGGGAEEDDDSPSIVGRGVGVARPAAGVVGCRGVAAEAEEGGFGAAVFFGEPLVALVVVRPAAGAREARDGGRGGRRRRLLAPPASEGRRQDGLRHRFRERRQAGQGRPRRLRRRQTRGRRRRRGRSCQIRAIRGFCQIGRRHRRR